MLIKDIALVLLFEAIVVQVNGVPLEVLVGEGSPEGRKRVRDATKDANDLVGKMETVYKNAVNGDGDSLGKIHKAFGVTPDMEGIGDNIQKLKVGRFVMDDAQHPTHIGPGFYDPHLKRVHLGSGFHLGTAPQDMAGMILHEASHSILGTKDIFDSKGQPTSEPKADTNRGDKTGYKDSDLPEMLKDPKFSKNLHQNADSWRVFGDLCRRELERRALEEPDLMKREEILQARAAACALPQRKSTSPAKGARNGGAIKDSTSGKRTTKQFTSRAASRPATRAANKPINVHGTSKPAVRAASKPAPARARTENKPVVRPASKLAALTSNKPAVRPANKPATPPNPKSVAPAANKPAAGRTENKPIANKPVTRPVSKPAALAGNNSGARPANKPAAQKPDTQPATLAAKSGKK